MDRPPLINNQAYDPEILDDARDRMEDCSPEIPTTTEPNTTTFTPSSQSEDFAQLQPPASPHPGYSVPTQPASSAHPQGSQGLSLPASLLLSVGYSGGPLFLSGGARGTTATPPAGGAVVVDGGGGSGGSGKSGGGHVCNHTELGRFLKACLPPHYSLPASSISLLQSLCDSFATVLLKEVFENKKASNSKNRSIVAADIYSTLCAIDEFEFLAERLRPHAEPHLREHVLFTYSLEDPEASLSAAARKKPRLNPLFYYDRDPAAVPASFSAPSLPSPPSPCCDLAFAAAAPVAPLRSASSPSLRSDVETSINEFFLKRQSGI